MGLLEKAFSASGSDRPPRAALGKGLLGMAERLHPQNTSIDGQNDTSSEITNLCIDRLSRLADDGSTVDTALSVLKAYFPIVAAFIFSQKAGEYVVSNSVGSPALKEGVSLQMQKHLVSAEKSEYPFPASDFGLDLFPANSIAYAYPLHTHARGVPKSILVLITENDKTSAQESMGKVILECAMKFSPKNDIKQTISEAINQYGTIPAEIVKACEIFGGKAQILILDLSGNALMTGEDTIASALSLLVGKSARYLRIEPSRFMIMLKDGIDRELYSHQLIKSAQSNLNLEPGQIRLIHSSDPLNPKSIHDLISTIKKGV